MYSITLSRFSDPTDFSTVTYYGSAKDIWGLWFTLVKLPSQTPNEFKKACRNGCYFDPYDRVTVIDCRNGIHCDPEMGSSLPPLTKKETQKPVVK